MTIAGDGVAARTLDARALSARRAVRAAALAAGVLAVGCGGGVAGGAGGGVGGPGHARAPGPPTAQGASPATGPESRLIVHPDPAGTAVAVALVFPGSGWELPGTEGLTLLTAETLLEQARMPLDELGARAAVACDRAAFTFTLVAPPESWAPALETLMSTLFRPEPSLAALAGARQRLGDALSLDQASPAWQARLAARQALYGDTLAGSAWETPACGVPESLGLFDLAHIRAGAYRFAPRMARIAILGPVDPDEARGLVEARLPSEPPPPVPGPRDARAGRRYVERNTVTAWISQAFPFPVGSDVEAIRALGALLADRYGPAVSRPEVFAVSYEVERHGGGGALIVHAVTGPDAALAVAEEVAGAVRAIAESGVAEVAWERVERRHRGERLLALEAPEARAGALARALALGDVPASDGWPHPEALTPDRLRAAAASLGPPARSVVGPRSARAAATP